MTPSKKHSSYGYNREHSHEKEKTVKSLGEEKMARGNRSGHGRSGSSRSSSKKYGSKEIGQTSSLVRSKHSDADGDRAGNSAAPVDDFKSLLKKILKSDNDPIMMETYCKQLTKAFCDPGNARYLKRSYDIILDSLCEIFFADCTYVIKDYVKQSVSQLIYNLDTEITGFYKWLLTIFPEKNDIMVYLLDAIIGFIQTEYKLVSHFKCESCLPSGTPGRVQATLSELAIIALQIGEHTENVDIVTKCIQLIEYIAAIDATIMPQYFHDMVDILVGWCFDLSQPKGLTRLVHKTLASFDTCWSSNLEFALTLISQLLEDTASSCQEYLGDISRTQACDKALACLKTLTLLFNCIRTSMSETSKEFLHDVLSKMASIGLQLVQCYYSEEILISINNICSVLLSTLHRFNYFSTNHNILIVLINYELSMCSYYSVQCFESMLYFISKVVKEASGNLSIELVHALLGPQSKILSMRTTCCLTLHNAIVHLYASLLSLKNIPILQEVYRLVLGDLEVAYRMVVPSIPEFVPNNVMSCMKYTPSSALVITLFLFKCISTLGNASNSLIGMWVLQPSVLELLVVHLEPDNVEVAARPVLHHTLLRLAHAHCSRYHNFVSSSCLIGKTDVQGMENSHKPTSQNLGMIVALLTRLLRLKKVAIQNQALITGWLLEVVSQCKPYLGTLLQSAIFVDLLETLIHYDRIHATPHDTNEDIVSCLNQLLPSAEIVKSIRRADLIEDLVENQLTCLYKSCYGSQDMNELLRLVPLSLLYKKLGDVYKKGNSATLSRLHSNEVTFMSKFSQGEMSAFCFRSYMRYLLLEEDTFPGGLDMSWLRSLYHLCAGPAHLDSVDSSLLFWASFASAQFCVTNRLRTPLGKPPDTLTAFDSSMKHLARHIITVSNDSYSLRRIRLVLDFMEQLDKCIINASDGTATALAAPSQSVRCFFSTNKQTCTEWLHRLRNTLMCVSLHAGLSSSAARHGMQLLRDLAVSSHTSSLDFDLSLLYLALSLLRLGDADSIHGLIVWTRRVTSVAPAYLKPLELVASGKWEAGGEELQQVLSQEGGKYPEVTRRLLSEQLVECYLAVEDWDNLATWLSTENTRKYNNWTTADIDLMKQIDRDEYNLSEWGQEECTHQDIGNVPYYYKLAHVKHSLVKYLTQRLGSKTIPACCTSLVESCRNTAFSYVKESMRNIPCELLDESFLCYHIAQCLLDNTELEFESISGGEEANLSSSLLAQILWWKKAMQGISRRSLLDLSSSESVGCLPTTALGALSLDNNWGKLSRLYLSVARTARKEGNIRLASDKINKFINKICPLGTGPDQDSSNLIEYVTLFNTNPALVIDSLDKVEAFKEITKLIYGHYSKETGVQLCANVIQQVSQYTSLERMRVGQPTGSRVGEINARLLLRLTQWLNVNETPSSLLRNILETTGSTQRFAGVSEKSESFIVSCDMTEIESVMYQLIQESIHQCPELSKSWHALGNWSYRRGWEIVRKPNTHLLTHGDRSIIESNLPTSLADRSAVYKILNTTKPINYEEDLDPGNVTTGDGLEVQLSACALFTHSQLHTIVDVWKRAHARVLGYYRLCAESYFQYLTLCETSNIGPGPVTATLRLLRLLVKHSLELRDVTEPGLSSTPPLPWTPIIPQLCSRLSHPEPYVRGAVSDLLCRIAQGAPHLIIFPAVVGSEPGYVKENATVSASKLFNTLVKPSEEDDDSVDIVDLDENPNTGDLLQQCFAAMVDSLAAQNAEAIAQIKIFVSELRRIALLWDEQWLGGLEQLISNMMKRLNQVETESNKLDLNPTLTEDEKGYIVDEKYRILLKPILFSLEQMHASTSGPAETPREQWFQETYSEDIETLLTKLKSPGVVHHQDAYSLLKTLQGKLAARAGKRCSYALKMSELSPVLAGWRDTRVAMPGVPSLVTIARVKEQVIILPTKTKPKKLVFVGSDGKSYTYLFKGLEDLHLDERIMQFLQISNTMLAASTYRARHYPVIPLGPRGGLISWVEHVTPLFSLYKRWQQRQVPAKAPVPRPSELFYGKLNPLLRERNISPDARKLWPLDILRQVLQELMQSTPDDLLATELWCHSQDAGAWWKSTRLYTSSLALNSIIGYIIGLGDRHLDNVLVDLHTGEVVHIDYNVCFEKGKTLRVPEKVPFRLTPNLVRALGLSGVEGGYKRSCEYVLKVMKKGRETFLTLLEAFIYDPLVDWAPGHDTALPPCTVRSGNAAGVRATRKQLEKEYSLAMYTLRRKEIAWEWYANRDTLLTSMQDIRDALTEYLSEDSAQKRLEAKLHERHLQNAYINEARTDSNHAFYSLPGRYKQVIEARRCRTNVLNTLQEKIEDCDKQLTQYKQAMVCLLGQWLDDVKRSLPSSVCQVFDLIKEFLQNAGQNSLVSQCCQLEQEISEAYAAHHRLRMGCVDILSKYSTICALYPASYINVHRSTSYKRWCQTLVISLDKYGEIKAEFSSLYSPPLADSMVCHQCVTFSRNLHRVLDVQREKERERAASGPALTSEEIYLYEAEQGLREFSVRAPVAVESAIVTALCALNKKFLLLECAAKSAADCLLDMTSRDGVWFLDDMCLTASMCVKLAALLPSPQDNIIQGVQCMENLYKVYNGLQTLNHSFLSVIMPGAIKSTLIEEPTVLGMIAQLNDIIHEAGLPLPELMKQMQNHLRFTIMGMASPNESALDIVASLKERYSALLSSTLDNGDLSQGQTLLMGFNSLFEKLWEDTSCLSSIEVPYAWRSVDFIKEAKSYMAPVLDGTHLALLTDIFFLKRLHCMHSFLTLCLNFARGYRGGANAPTTVYSDAQFHRPVRAYIADCVARTLAGSFSHCTAVTIVSLLAQSGFNVQGEIEQRDIGAESKVPLESLCRAACDSLIRRHRMTASSLSQASTLLSHYETAWRHTQHMQRFRASLEVATGSEQRLSVQYTAHHFLHEDTLSASIAGGHVKPSPINRGSFMLELRKSTSALATSQSRLTDLRDQMDTLVATLQQRLKWAAGANPALTEVTSAFEDVVRSEKDKLSEELKLGSTLNGICHSILQHEALRTRTSEALSNDVSFLQLLDQAEKAYKLDRNLRVTITELEADLMTLLPNITQVDRNVLDTAGAAVSRSMTHIIGDMVPQSCLFSTQLGELSTTLHEHDVLFHEMKHLMKTIIKFEEYTSCSPSVDELTRSERSLAELIASIDTLLRSEEPGEQMSSVKVNQVLDLVGKVETKAPEVYAALYSIKLETNPPPSSRGKRPPLLRQASVCLSPARGPPEPSAPPRPEGAAAANSRQEINGYALGVLRRVKMKLVGLDPDPTRRYSVQEQVEWVISEATNIDNLALLYEGWTPWV
uniref:non-specific serine/threonine protein kinase n=1 Tax=Cacopsylla melanoneura TaxID=428564 RepID=A0A8D9A0V0_9HEMI